MTRPRVPARLAFVDAMPATTSRDDRSHPLVETFASYGITLTRADVLSLLLIDPSVSLTLKAFQEMAAVGIDVTAESLRIAVRGSVDQTRTSAAVVQPRRVARMWMVDSMVLWAAEKQIAIDVDEWIEIFAVVNFNDLSQIILRRQRDRAPITAALLLQDAWQAVARGAQRPDASALRRSAPMLVSRESEDRCVA